MAHYTYCWPPPVDTPSAGLEKSPVNEALTAHMGCTFLHFAPHRITRLPRKGVDNVIAPLYDHYYETGGSVYKGLGMQNVS